MHQKTDIFERPGHGELQVFPADYPRHERGRNQPPMYVPSSNGQRFIIVDQEQARQAKGDTSMNSSSIGRLEFWLGIAASIVGFVVIGCGATWTISSNINDKVNESRVEIANNIQVSKTELATRIDKLETKVDAGFKDTTSGINDIKIILSSTANNTSNKKQ